MVARIPRGHKFPKPFMYKAKITEGKNTLRAIAKAYGVHHCDLSRVLSGKRNTKHLIEILESEYRMPIEEIRILIKEAKEASLKQALQIKEKYLGEQNEG